MFSFLMSRGPGQLQRKIIKYLKENPNIFRMDIIRAVAKNKPPTKKDKKNIYKSIKKLVDEEIIIPSRIRNLWLMSKEYKRKVKPKPEPLKINPQYDSNKRFKKT